MRTIILLLLLATFAHAEEPPRYSAQDTIRRAQIGRYSPRMNPPPSPPPAVADGEGLVCYVDHSKPLTRNMICKKIKKP